MPSPEHYQSLILEIRRLQRSKNAITRRRGVELEEKLLNLTDRKKTFIGVEQAIKFPETGSPEASGEQNGLSEQLTEIRTHLAEVKSFLCLDVALSQSYELIGDVQVQQQLRADNRHMMLVRQGRLVHFVGPQFEVYCRYAHLQIEEMLSYLFLRLCSSDSRIQVQRLWLHNQLLVVSKYFHDRASAQTRSKMLRRDDGKYSLFVSQVDITDQVLFQGECEKKMNGFDKFLAEKTKYYERQRVFKQLLYRINFTLPTVLHNPVDYSESGSGGKYGILDSLLASLAMCRNLDSHRYTAIYSQVNQSNPSVGFEPKFRDFLNHSDFRLVETLIDVVYEATVSAISQGLPS